MTYKIGFVLEQALGHVTHARNLQQNVALRTPISGAALCTPLWLLIPYEVQGSAARIPLYKSNWTVRAGLRARAALRQAKKNGPIDGILFHTQVPAVLCADWISAYPSVVSLDATPLQYDLLGEFYHHEKGPAWLEGLKFRLNVQALRAARRLVSWTEWTRQSLIRDYGMPAEKITVIPPGVNPGLWTRPEGLQQALGWDWSEFYLWAAIFWRKGGDLLMEAFRSLRSEHPDLDLELHLVTKTPVEPGAGIFVYADFGPNDPRLVALYHQSDIFALPTSGDCLPMVLSEAGAAGLPAISTTVAGIPEIVADGKSGLLIPPGDGRALRLALEKLVGDRQACASDGDAGRQKLLTASVLTPLKIATAWSICCWKPLRKPDDKNSIDGIRGDPRGRGSPGSGRQTPPGRLPGAGRAAAGGPVGLWAHARRGRLEHAPAGKAGRGQRGPGLGMFPPPGALPTDPDGRRASGHSAGGISEILWVGPHAAQNAPRHDRAHYFRSPKNVVSGYFAGAQRHRPLPGVFHLAEAFHPPALGGGRRESSLDSIPGRWKILQPGCAPA